MVKIKKTTIYVQGMHCPSCDILIKDKIGELGNVKEVKADFKTQKAEICYIGSFGKNQIDEANKKIAPFGYQINNPSTSLRTGQQLTIEPLTKRFFDFGAIAVILFILFFFAQELNLIPKINTNGTLTFGTVFLLGLIASTSTCMATSGALFLATIGKINNNNLFPAISFNLGRILSYGFFGFIAGLIGKTLVSNLQISSLFTLVISFFMVVIGLDMAKIISLQGIFTQTFTKGIFERLNRRLIKNPQKSALLLGAITYFLPCGFTQTVQLYALGLANPVQSAGIMMIFALGTTPALLAIGFTSSFTKFSFYPTIQKVMGTLVFLVGMYYFTNFLSIYGINLNIIPSLQGKARVLGSNVRVENGVQVVSMNVNFSGYYPNSFTVKKDVPVRWEINGENVFGCQGYLIVPKLGIQKTLTRGINLIEFTPKEEGTIGFSCAMGMYRGVFNVES